MKTAMFAPHQNLSDRINGNIIRSEIEGGVDLRHLPLESTLEVETRNRAYTLVMQPDCHALISGHPEFCPEPVLVHINGSNWGGSMIRTAYLGRGMHLEFRHPNYEGLIVTSAIQDIRLRDRTA
jgi:hypothetical protein